ncbi:hypothetical protein C0J52_09426 [Blattella germanica]|nr:hypothetical protein C0J52_09426 [Blattella germanica]
MSTESVSTSSQTSWALSSSLVEKLKEPSQLRSLATKQVPNRMHDRYKAFVSSGRGLGPTKKERRCEGNKLPSAGEETTLRCEKTSAGQLPKH